MVQALGLPRVGLPPSVRRAGALVDRGGCAVEQLRIFEQLAMCREDTSALGIRLGGQPLLQRAELPARGGNGRVQRAVLELGIRRTLLYHSVVVAQLKHLP